MTRIFVLLSLLLLATVPMASGAATEEAWEATPGGWVSGDLTYLGTIPFEAGTGIDAVRHGDYLYTTTWRSFSIYDVSDPLAPELLSQTPVPAGLINESPQTDGSILLISNDNVNRTLDIYDVTDKRAPALLAKYTDPANNHMWTCVLDCRYAYGARGSILDLADPSQPTRVGDWTNVRRPTAYHAITEVAPGLVMVGSTPVLYFDARQDPSEPTLLTELKPKTTNPGRPYLVIGPAPTSLPARTAWPLAGESRHLLITMETPFSGECNEHSGTFLSYDTQGWDQEGFEGFTLADEYAVTGNGLPSDGSAPVNVVGCGAYGLDVHPWYEQNGLAATTWFEHGTRVLRVDAEGRFHEVGGFVGAGGNAVRPLWLTNDILYVVDLQRGIDILRVSSEDRRHRAFPYATPAGDLDGDGHPDVLTAESIAERESAEAGIVSFRYRVTARRGSEGGLLWELPLRADELHAARLGPQATHGALLVNGERTSTMGGGGSSSQGFGDRVELRGLNLTAVDGEGAELWERVFDAGVFAGVAVADEEEGRRQASVVERFPTFGGLVQATPSAASDVLVSTLTRRETPAGLTSSIDVSIVDGATGANAGSFTVQTEGTRSAVHPAGDLDGDGLDDVLVLRDPTEGGLTARRASDGAVIWSNPADIVPFEVSIRDLGDVTGDGISEIAVSGSGDVFDGSPPRVTVLDGAGGEVLLSTIAGAVSVAGVVDEEGTIGIMTQRVIEEPERGVLYRLHSPEGETLLETVVPVPQVEGQSTSVQLTADAGDLDGDGVRDAGHRRVFSTQAAGTTSEGTMVSGATLTPLQGGDAGLPLHASLDGAGDELVRVARSAPGELTVTATDGSGAAIWSRAVRADERYGRQGRISVAAAGDVDGDGIPDVLLSVETSRVVPGRTGGSHDESIVQSWVLTGVNGRVLWGT